MERKLIAQDHNPLSNKIAAGNAGWPFQFRFAVYGLALGVAEFYR